MNNILDQMKSMKRAMQPYTLFLYELILESNAQKILEIGVRQAQSTRTILAAIKEKGSGFLTSIDLGDRTERIKDTFPELLPFWKLIIGDSHSEDIFDNVKDKIYDVLFIDGDHSYEGMKKDYEMYSPLVRDGGYILFHDTHNINEGCPKAWNEIEAKEKLQLDYGFAGFGIIHKV